jgi:hypothetical protein
MGVLVVSFLVLSSILAELPARLATVKECLGDKNMDKKDTITVYWSPAKFNTDEQSWNMLYREPRHVLSSVYKKNKHKGEMSACPSMKDTFRNIYSFDSALDDSFSLPSAFLKTIADTNTVNEVIPTDSKLMVYKSRKSSIENYINIGYNLGWIFFADEPLEARMTSPFFPATSPAKNAMLSAGQFNIGKWFRSFELDYHIPVTSTRFQVAKNEPLFFLELLTDKKVVFERFELTPKLQNYSIDMALSPKRYGKKKSLLERYLMAHGAGLPRMVLSEIRKNLVS